MCLNSWPQILPNYLEMIKKNHSIRVYLEDTDAGGILYYVNYLKYMERARTETLRQTGISFGDLGANALQFVVHSVEIKYKKPAFMDDLLTATAEVVKMGRSFVEFKQSILRDEELLCEAMVKVACINAETFKLAAIPERIKQGFLS